MPPVIVMGVAGSGKSTVGRALADHLGWTFVEGDDYHPAANVAKMRSGVPLSDEDRQPWLRALGDVISAAAEKGRPVVITCSALKRAYRDQLRVRCPSVAFVYLAVDQQVLAARLAARPGHFMRPAMLASQLDDLEEPAESEALCVDGTLPVDDLVERVVSLIDGWSVRAPGTCPELPERRPAR